jgi:HAD superfamily hydrolase (TIGR01509 family)
MKPELRGLLLDFDGTIAETERFGQRVAFNHAFAEMGLDWHWGEELYADLVSVAGGKERLRYYLARYRPALLTKAIDSGLIEELHRARVRHFARIAPTIRLRPGVFRLMQETHAAGIAIAVATAASKPAVEALLSQNEELPTIVKLIAAYDAVDRRKPAPDIYVWALDKLRLEAGNCVAIEDSGVGMRAALAAGLPTIITVSDYTANDDFTGAAAVVSDLGERYAPACSLQGRKPLNGIVDVAFLRAILDSAT